jgi:hypothetical protein
LQADGANFNATRSKACQQATILDFNTEHPSPPNTIVMENTFDKTTVETIDLLEARLRRIEYAVYGQVNESTLSSNKTSATQRLAALEHSLHQLASKSRVVQDLLRLRKFPATDPNNF